MKKLLLLSIPFLFSFSTCGHRGDPLPPLTKDPATPQVESLVQDFNRPLLVWREVRTYRDGRKLPDPRSVRYVIVVNFGKKKVKTGKNYFLDVPVKPGERRCYSIISVYRGRESPPGNPICIVGKRPIHETPEFEAIGGDNHVVINVKNPDFPLEVFRNQEEPFLKPYATFKGRTFIDRNVENGKSYRYRLRFYRGKLKGKLSREVTVIPQDRIPPLPPSYAYVITGRICSVVWDPSPSSDVVYYEVKSGDLTLKTSGIYLNLPGCNGTVSVIAVDKAGNRSKPVRAEVVK